MVIKLPKLDCYFILKSLLAHHWPNIPRPLMIEQGQNIRLGTLWLILTLLNIKRDSAHNFGCEWYYCFWRHFLKIVFSSKSDLASILMLSSLLLEAFVKWWIFIHIILHINHRKKMNISMDIGFLNPSTKSFLSTSTDLCSTEMSQTVPGQSSYPSLILSRSLSLSDKVLICKVKVVYWSNFFDELFILIACYFIL